jgi:hypothetical protein
VLGGKASEVGGVELGQGADHVTDEGVSDVEHARIGLGEGPPGEEARDDDQVRVGEASEVVTHQRCLRQPTRRRGHLLARCCESVKRPA